MVSALNRLIIPVILLLLLAGCFVIDDPVESRSCECELLREWLRDLPIAPIDVRLEGITVTESTSGISMTASLEESHVPADLRENLPVALEKSEIALSLVSDTPEHWEARVAPSERPIPEDRWRGRITIENGLGFTISVTLDPTPYGYDDISELGDVYQNDRETALANQLERQIAAIELLEPFRQALASLADEEQ